MVQMAEYIERAALEDALNKRLAYLFKENGEFDHYTNGYDEAVDTVENFPSADVTPVVHGWWESIDSTCFRRTLAGVISVPCKRFRCSRCGRETAVKSNFCPGCGAKLEALG